MLYQSDSMDELMCRGCLKTSWHLFVLQFELRDLSLLLKETLTCCPSSVRPTLVSTGLWHYDGVLISPHLSAHAPSSSAGTLLFPGRS